MMMKNSIIFLIAMLLLVSCGNDDISDERPVLKEGSLKVLVEFTGGLPVEGASVRTEPATREVSTDMFGIALFESLELGTYEVFVDIGENFEVKKATVTIEEDQIQEVPFVFEPIGVSPAPVNIEELLNASYAGLKSPGVFGAQGYSFLWGDIGADIGFVDAASPILDLDNYRLNATNRFVEKVWVGHYELIRLVNQGIELVTDLDPASNPEVDKNEALAEFRFLRALMYFNLVKIYGNPVLVTSSSIILDPQQASIQDREQVYELIVNDLIFAENNLKSTATTNRASKPVAQALLGKVYLQMASFPLLQNDKYTLALEQFNKLEGVYALETEYSAVFDIANETTNSEVIFAIDFDGSVEGGGGNYGVFWGPLGVALNDDLLLAPGLAESYFDDPSSVMSPVTFPLAVEDKRFDQNIASYAVENNQRINSPNLDDWRPYKYQKDLSLATVKDQESFDFVYLRYADVLLMIAEAENVLNGPTQIAYDAINKVRRRAFGDMDHDLAAGLNQEQFLDAVLNERRLEFCFEGHRKDDLVRTQRLEVVIDDFNTANPQNRKEFQPHNYIWPIPIIEINVNPAIVQNPGY